MRKHHLLNLLIGICLSLSLFSSTGCHDEGIVIPGFDVDCDYYIGDYKYQSSSVAKVPYEGKQGVVFQDSLGNEITFTISTTTTTEEEHYITKSEPNNETIRIYYCYHQDKKIYFLKSNSTLIEFKGELQATPYRAQPLHEYYYDEFYITSNSIILNGSIGYNLASHTTIIDPGNAPTLPVINKLPELQILGKQFFNAEFRTSFLQGINPVSYYTQTEGLINYTDSNGVLWRFDRWL